MPQELLQSWRLLGPRVLEAPPGLLQRPQGFSEAPTETSQEAELRGPQRPRAPEARGLLKAPGLSRGPGTSQAAMRPQGPQRPRTSGGLGTSRVGDFSEEPQGLGGSGLLPGTGLLQRLSELLQRLPWTQGPRGLLQRLTETWGWDFSNFGTELETSPRDHPGDLL
jgi:hypothetical protein